MKVIINGRFLIHRVTGVERYAREILSELDKIIEPESIEMAVPSEVEDVPTYKNIKVIKVGKLHNRLWEHLSFPWYVYKNKGVSLNLCNVAPLPAPGIVCIHDVKVKATPQYFSKKFLIKNTGGQLLKTRGAVLHPAMPKQDKGGGIIPTAELARFCPYK